MKINHLQLGKNGLTEGFLETIEEHFKHHKNVKISVLKSCCRSKIELDMINEKILERLGPNHNSRTIGYTINIKKTKSKK